MGHISDCALPQAAGPGSSDSALKAAAGSAIWLDGRRFFAGASAAERGILFHNVPAFSDFGYDIIFFKFI